MSATVKIPPFEALDPKFWFQQCESQFIIAKVADDQIKYHYIVAHLPLKISRLVRDVIKHEYTTNLYVELKQAVIDRLSTHASARVNALLDDTRMQPGELPSHFYRRMMELAATDVSFNVVFSRFISLIPSDSIQSEANTVLANFKEAQKVDDKRVAAILDTADAIASRSGKQVAATHQPDALQRSTPRPQRQQQPSQRHFQYQGSHQQRSSTFSWFCFNHARFGEDTRQCSEPGKCTYRHNTTATVDADDKFSDAVEVFYNSAITNRSSRSRSQRLFVKDDVHRVMFLIDTGSDVSLISRSSLSLFTVGACAASTICLRAANGSAIKTYGSALINISLGRNHFAFPFIAADIEQCVIGADFLSKFSFSVNINKRMIFNEKSSISCIRGYGTSSPISVVVSSFPVLHKKLKSQDSTNPAVRHPSSTASRPRAATLGRLYGDKPKSAKHRVRRTLISLFRSVKITFCFFKMSGEGIKPSQVKSQEIFNFLRSQTLKQARCTNGKSISLDSFSRKLPCANLNHFIFDVERLASCSAVASSSKPLVPALIKAHNCSPHQARQLAFVADASSRPHSDAFFPELLATAQILDRQKFTFLSPDLLKIRMRFLPPGNSTLLYIDRIRTAPFNPRANGLIERFHRSLKAFSYARKQDWLTALPVVLLGLRTTFRDTPQASPAELVFGTTLQLPGSFLDESRPPAETITPHTFVQDLKRTMSELQLIQTTSSTEDSPFIPKSLQDATQVFFRKHLRTGLTPPYVGPFLIIIIFSFSQLNDLNQKLWLYLDTSLISRSVPISRSPFELIMVTKKFYEHVQSTSL